MPITSGSRVFRAAAVNSLTLDGDDQLGDHRQNLGSSLLQQIKDPLNRQKSIRVLLFSEALEEDRKVVVIVELSDVDLPSDSAS